MLNKKEFPCYEGQARLLLLLLLPPKWRNYHWRNVAFSVKMNTANCLPGERRRARGVAVTWARLGGLSANWLLHVPQESRGYATSGEQWRYAIVTFTVSPRHSWPPATSLYQAQAVTHPSLPLACHIGTFHYVSPGTRDLSCTRLTAWSVSKESSLGVDETFCLISVAAKWIMSEIKRGDGLVCYVVWENMTWKIRRHDPSPSTTTMMTQRVAVRN